MQRRAGVIKVGGKSVGLTDGAALAQLDRVGHYMPTRNVQRTGEPRKFRLLFGGEYQAFACAMREHQVRQIRAIGTGDDLDRKSVV